MPHIIPDHSPAVTLAIALLLIITALALAFALHERRRVDELAETVAYQGKRLRAHGALIHAVADAVTEDYELPAAGLERPALYVIDGEARDASTGTDRRAELLVVTG